MLFDLRGKRRRLIQVSFLAMAVLFAISSTVFFVGSGFDFNGSLFDVIGGDGSNKSGRVEKAQKAVKKQPKDQAAWIELTRARYLEATSSEFYDRETGTFKPGSKSELKPVTTAWEHYLALEPKKPNANVASLVVKAYIGLEDFDGAIKAQQYITQAQPSAGTFFELARYAYFAGNTRIADGAADRSVALTPEKQRKRVRKQLDLVKKQAQQLTAQKAVSQSGAQQ